MISCSCALSLCIKNRCWNRVRYIRNGEQVCDLLIRKNAFKRESAVKLRGTGHDRLLLRRACWGLVGLLDQTELHYLGQRDGFLEACWSRDELTHYEIHCRDIHKHGVDLHTRRVNTRANRQFATAHVHSPNPFHRPEARSPGILGLTTYRNRRGRSRCRRYSEACS